MLSQREEEIIRLEVSEEIAELSDIELVTYYEQSVELIEQGHSFVGKAEIQFKEASAACIRRHLLDIN